MNKWEIEVQKSLLQSEAAAIKALEAQYKQALTEVKRKVQDFQAEIDMLDAAASQDGIDDATRALLLSQKRSKIYQKQYQTALQGQISAILDKMHGDNYSTIQAYLKGSYESGYVGAMYDMAKQGVPVIVPIDQAAAVRAILTDSKISKGLYNRLGVEVSGLKRSITQEISRGISVGMSYADIARNIANVSRAPLSRTMTITRTEGHRIQQASTVDAQQAAKAKGADVVKQWDATLDGNTRDSHRAVDGEIRELDEKFSNGLMYPGDPSGPAAEVINCRCTSNTRARWALDEDELNTLKERAEFFGLDKTENFEEFKAKYLDVSDQIVKAEADTPSKSINGDTIIFDDKLNNRKWSESVKVIKQLSGEYDTRLYKVTAGADRGGGTVDMGGLMRLSSNAPDIAYHEFAHSMAMEALTKYKVVDDSAFWKEIKAVRRAYMKDVGDDTARWISTYEHGSRSVDEFFAEAFAQAKMSQLGLSLPEKYGTDLTYSNKVLEIVDKYFKKPLENSDNGGKIKIGVQFFAKMPEEKFTAYALNPQKAPDKAKAFKNALGYDMSNFKDLIQNINDHIDESKFVEKDDIGYGMRYEYVVELEGPNGKKANVLTAWIQDGKDKRLTSAYVTGKKVTK